MTYLECAEETLKNPAANVTARFLAEAIVKMEKFLKEVEEAISLGEINPEWLAEYKRITKGR